MLNKFKDLCNSEVTVNTIWYYVLLGLVVLDVVTWFVL
jgi:hypothetical protein